MMYGGNGLTSWLVCFAQNKLTMFRAHCPFNPRTLLAETKVMRYPPKYVLAFLVHVHRGYLTVFSLY
jgi:hypothetical protein